ncbi:MAG: MFS transporter [Proteobacteria bacterium]|nr:MFS transporter [Pseudomonadota bacterium]
MVKYSKSLFSLLLVVLTDSLGWGIAFSVFAGLILNEHSSFLSLTMSHSSRYMLYEGLLAVYSFFMFFFAPVLGGVSDHYGRKPGLQISMAGLTIGFLLSALACYLKNLEILILGRIISGMTAGSLSVAQAAVVDVSTPQTKSAYLSILVLANCLGFSLGPILGGMLERIAVGPTGVTTFLFGAFMSFAGLISILFYFKETYVIDTQGKKLQILKDFSNIKIALLKPVVNYYLFSFLVSMVAYGLFFSNVPVFLHRLFASNSSTIGLVLGGFTFLLSISLLCGAKLIFNFFKEPIVVSATQLIQLVVYLLISLSIHSFVLNCVLFACISLTVALLYIGLLTMISNVTETDWQGRIMGVVASLFALNWGIGPLLAGFLNHYGLGAPFICSALLVAAGFAILRNKVFCNTLHKLAK